MSTRSAPSSYKCSNNPYKGAENEWVTGVKKTLLTLDIQTPAEKVLGPPKHTQNTS